MSVVDVRIVQPLLGISKRLVEALEVGIAGGEIVGDWSGKHRATVATDLPQPNSRKSQWACALFPPREVESQTAPEAVPVDVG